jgi:hypothetical protein
MYVCNVWSFDSIRELTLTFGSEGCPRQILHSSTHSSSLRFLGILGYLGTSLTPCVSVGSSASRVVTGEGGQGAGDGAPVDVAWLTGEQLTPERLMATRVERMVKRIVSDLY